MLRNIFLLIIIIIILIHLNNNNTNEELKLKSNIINNESVLNSNKKIILNSNNESVLNSNNESVLNSNNESVLNSNNESVLISNKESVLNYNKKKFLNSNEESFLNYNEESFLNYNEELNYNKQKKLDYNKDFLLNKKSDYNPNKEIKLNNNISLDNDYKIIDFDKPNPWTKVICDKSQEYHYNFYIKIIIPSLNNYQEWKEIIPNIDFIPKTGELIIPAKDEPSALALANLIISNLMGYLSINDILEKKLIQISIAKCKSHEIVQNKIRQQIIDMLYPNNINLSINIDNIDNKNKIKNKKNIIKEETNDNITPHNYINNINNNDNNDNNNNDNIDPYIYGDSSYSYL